MELLLIIISRSPGFNSKRISECDDDEEEEEEDDNDYDDDDDKNGSHRKDLLFR